MAFLEPGQKRVREAGSNVGKLDCFGGGEEWFAYFPGSTPKYFILFTKTKVCMLQAETIPILSTELTVIKAC